MEIAALLSSGFIWLIFIVLTGFHAVLFYLRGYIIGARGTELAELVFDFPGITLPILCFLSSLSTYAVGAILPPWFARICCQSYGIGDLMYVVGVGSLVAPQWRRTFHLHFSAQKEAFIVVLYALWSILAFEYVIPWLDLIFSGATFFAFAKARREVRS